MKSKLYFLVLFLFIFLACEKEDDINKRKLTYSDFKNNLKSDMDYNTIVVKFGLPARDDGSGIHIYVYVLKDSTEVWIGYTDKIVYASYMDKDQQLIEDIF